MLYLGVYDTTWVAVVNPLFPEIPFLQNIYVNVSQEKDFMN